MTEHYRGLKAGLSSDVTAMGSFDDSAELSVYYVTNRVRSSSANQQPYYGSLLARDGLTYFGEIKAMIPREEPMGGRREFDVTQGAFRPQRGVKLGVPIAWYDKQGSSGTTNISDADTDPPPPKAKDLAEFVAHLKVRNPTKKPILLYVHGFNNTFSFVMQRAASFAYDMGGSDHFLPLVFSWPAVGNLESVTRDENNTGPSSVPLAELLRLLLADADGPAVHLVTHSMGTRIVSQALLRLSADRPPGRQLTNLVIAAGDMDGVEFAMPQQVEQMKRHAALTSIYICDHDVALYGSMHMHGPSNPPHRRPRIGQAGDHRTVINDAKMQTIDATLVELSIENHGYLFENRLVLDDVFMLLRHNLPAEKRNLLSAMQGNARFFLIRR